MTDFGAHSSSGGGGGGSNGRKISTEETISGPSNFRHMSHVGWDPTTGFEAANLPPEWRRLFDAAGIHTTELADLPTSRYIYDTVVTALPTAAAAAASASSPSAAVSPASSDGRLSSAGSSMVSRGSTSPELMSARSGPASPAPRTPSRKELPDLSELPPEAQQRLVATLTVAMQRRTSGMCMWCAYVYEVCVCVCVCVCVR